jgi:hypothetical protein
LSTITKGNDNELAQTYRVGEIDRQMILNSLALTAQENPGWFDCLQNIAAIFDTPEAKLFNTFYCIPGKVLAEKLARS